MGSQPPAPAQRIKSMKLSAATLLLLLIGLWSTKAIAQGPIDGYLKGKGEADIALGFSVTGAEEFIGGDGQQYDLPFRGQLLSLFAAYGLTEGVDLIASIPYVITSSSSGLQDGALFVKGRLLKLPLAENQHLDILGAAGISTPLSQYEVVAAGAIGQRAQVVQPRLIAQYNRPGFFASTVLGYNYRFDELDLQRLEEIQRTRPGYRPEQPQDYLTGLLRLGIPTSTFYADVWLEVQRTLGGSDYVPDVEELPQPYDVDYQQVGGTVYYSEGSNFGFAASGAAFLGGRNTSKLWRISATLIYKVW